MITLFYGGSYGEFAFNLDDGGRLLMMDNRGRLYNVVSAQLMRGKNRPIATRGIPSGVEGRMTYVPAIGAFSGRFVDPIDHKEYKIILRKVSDTPGFRTRGPPLNPMC
jgi:hypothetical protein